MQVATSFLRELSDIECAFSDNEVIIYVSSEVAENLGDTVHQLKQNFDVQEFDVFGLAAFSPKIRKKYHNFDLIFSLFGPDYLPMIGAKKVIGFAQPWILYNNSDAYQSLGLLSALKSKMTFWLKKQLFKGADAYVVELEHVKERMLSKNIGHENNIHIAYNTISGNYREMKEQKLQLAEKTSEVFKLGIISRNYSHKNLSILPEVKLILEERYHQKIEFYVTFKKEEFHGESSIFQNQVVNLGPKKVDECIDTYLEFDGVFFPSLLECFSATPLEAMATGRALFASDRPFNRNVCGEHAYYFDPLSPEDAARVIDDYIENKWRRDLEERLAAREHAINFSNPRDRALKYIEVINKVLS
ncbi:glycosyltransferase [Pseudidiomarina andamanensis]|uniref:glycosyltransferase n=1 Tax=Pseudidiomarina andamanensis TaxID=1940690 RepID=UPI0015644B53|nr:glycosyltransferase [Pseudidiomarina andamanensis]MDS0217763.1 glycosyltransferase [Pseudidiomarina andamanensis]